MTRIALVTTTVNVPRNLRAWAACLRPELDAVYVAGDRRTPHVDVAELLEDVTRETGVLGHYLDPAEQATRWPQLSNVVGWSSVQRRNLATLAALEEDPSVVLTVDDDNWPTEARPEVGDLLNATLCGPPGDHTAHASASGWYNACLRLVPGPVWHRGFPRSVRDAALSGSPAYSFLRNEHGRVGVLAMLWLGAPDVDALDRYRADREVTAYDSADDVTLAYGTWCPFNSQATAWRAELAPALLYWPGVGRYDDVWASYLCQRVMQERELLVRFGRPLVRQDRDEHGRRDFPALVRDLRAELLGYERNEEVIAALREVELPNVVRSVTEQVTGYHAKLEDLLTWIPAQTRDAWFHWLTALDDVDRAVTAGRSDR